MFRVTIAKKIIYYLRPKLDDECREIIAKLIETNRHDCKRIITLCVPRHGNSGDIAIALAQRKLLATKFPEYVLIELPGELCRDYPHIIVHNLNESDILIINGGSWFGSLWKHSEIEVLKILRHFPNNMIIIMPQTIYYFDNKQGKR